MDRKKYLLILAVSLACLGGCQSPDKMASEQARAEAVPDTMNDLVYRDYGEASSMKAGSTWTLTMEKDKNMYAGMNVYICNKENGKITEIAKYAEQNYVEYTIPEDGTYVVYLAENRESEDIIDVTRELEVMYASGGVDEKETELLPLDE